MDFFATGGFQQLLSDLHAIDYNNNNSSCNNNNNDNDTFMEVSALPSEQYAAEMEFDARHSQYTTAFDGDGVGDGVDGVDHDAYNANELLLLQQMSSPPTIASTPTTTRHTANELAYNDALHSALSNSASSDGDYNNNNKKNIINNKNDDVNGDDGDNTQLQKSLDILLSNNSSNSWSRSRSRSSSSSQTSHANGDVSDGDAADGDGDYGDTGMTGSDDDEMNDELNALLDLDLIGVLLHTDDVDGINTANGNGATNALITREMSEWEDKFLDNYIEIPELIDILPEKTPLCNEMCELFLHESSKQLKLSRKRRQTAPKVTKPLERRANTPIAMATAAATTPTPSPSPTRSRQRAKPQRTAAAPMIGPVNGYPCTYGNCSNVYAKPAHLKAHLRRHMGEKPYICQWPDCTWRFSRSDELARHRRSHSGVKPYKCVYCTKCFARSDHLTKHRKVHERRMLAASREGRGVDGVLPASVFTVRPGRKKKNQC